MEQTYAVLEIDGREPVECRPGDLVGRLASARLCVQDPRVSEAHALVSARANALWLLALRHPIEGSWRVPLRAGLAIQLVEGIALRVLEVRAPAPELCLVLDGDRRTLERRHYGVYPGRGRDWLVPDAPWPAPLEVWGSEDRWYWRLADREPVEILPDGPAEGRHQRVDVDGSTVFAEVPSTPWTTTAGEPPRVVLEFRCGAVHVLVDGRPAGQVRDRPAAILRKLRDGRGRADLGEFDKSALSRLRHQLRLAAAHPQDPLRRVVLGDGIVGYELAANYELRAGDLASGVDPRLAAVLDVVRGATTAREAGRRLGRGEAEVDAWRRRVLAALGEVDLG